MIRKSPTVLLCQNENDFGFIQFYQILLRSKIIYKELLYIIEETLELNCLSDIYSMIRIKHAFNKSERVLVFGLAGILIGLVLQGVYFAHYITASSTDFIHAFNENVNSIVHLSLANKYIADLRVQLTAYPLLTTEQRKVVMIERSQTKNDLAKALADVREYLKICDEREIRKKELVEFEQLFQKSAALHSHYFELVDQGKIEEAAQFRNKFTNPPIQAASDILTLMIRGESEHASHEGAELQEEATAEVYKMWGFVIISACLSLICLYFLIKRFQKLRSELEKSEIIHENRMNVLAITAANIGHEIKNPLAVIKARIEMSLKKVQSKSTEYEKIEKDLTQSVKYVERIVKIVNGLKTLSHKDDNSPMEEYDLKFIMFETLDLAAQKMHQHFVELKTPVEIPDLVLYCHSVQISQVILNLVNNSCDAIKEQKDKWIEINYVIVANPKKSQEKNLLIQITDSGGGISKEFAQKIMQAFFTTKKKGEGTGIGLSISQEIIKDHGGELRIDTNCKNTRFEIILPIHSLKTNSEKIISAVS